MSLFPKVLSSWPTVVTLPFCVLPLDHHPLSYLYLACGMNVSQAADEGSGVTEPGSNPGDVKALRPEAS